MAKNPESHSRDTTGKSKKPMAKPRPVGDGQPIDIFGRMAGTIKIVGDIVSPLDVEWTGDAENL